MSCDDCKLISCVTKREYVVAEVRKNGDLPYLRPDAKSQVTFAYDGDTIAGIDAVVLSTQHNQDISLEQLQREVKENIIAPVLPEA